MRALQQFGTVEREEVDDFVIAVALDGVDDVEAQKRSLQLRERGEERRVGGGREVVLEETEEREEAIGVELGDVEGED